jgi:toxin-antitoxin system PIN domain toxin
MGALSGICSTKMESPDVNVLIYAFDESAPRHAEYLAWLNARVNGSKPFALAEPVWSGFLRITTNQRLFQRPVSFERSLAFIERVRSSRTCRPLLPGAPHWPIFLRLYREANAMANDIPDAYLAALAVEADCEWITTDSGFSRFKGLKYRHPLTPVSK